MAQAVYLLCAATSIICALLLFRGYRSSRTRLLFWSSLCFFGLAVNNVLLFLDLVVFTGPEIDLSFWRSAVAAASVSVLVCGLIWESK
jgi:hypothetical protein